jgi:hypothetical protein
MDDRELVAASNAGAEVTALTSPKKNTPKSVIVAIGLLFCRKERLCQGRERSTWATFPPSDAFHLGHFTDWGISPTALWQKAHLKRIMTAIRIQSKIEQIAQPSFIQSDTHPRT